jgi:hypothetical protein
MEANGRAAATVFVERMVLAAAGCSMMKVASAATETANVFLCNAIPLPE